jgi:hypothetical protein
VVIGPVEGARTIEGDQPPLVHRDEARRPATGTQGSGTDNAGAGGGQDLAFNDLAQAGADLDHVLLTLLERLLGQLLIEPLLHLVADPLDPGLTIIGLQVLAGHRSHPFLSLPVASPSPPEICSSGLLTPLPLLKLIHTRSYQGATDFATTSL